MTSKQLQEIASDIIERGIQDFWTDYASDYGYAFNVIPESDIRLINIQLNYMGAIELPRGN